MAVAAARAVRSRCVYVDPVFFTKVKSHWHHDHHSRTTEPPLPPEPREAFVDRIEEATSREEAYVSVAEDMKSFWQYQPQVQRFYTKTSTELVVAALIGGNFLSNIVEASIDPQHDLYPKTFEAFELFFNIAFTIELAINMYAFWFWSFWHSGWNVFDLVVVLIGLLTTCNVPLPGPFKMLRMMRAFRVFRLFKRITALRKILKSLAQAVPGVLNAFIILVLVMCIYGILAVEFWSTYGGSTGEVPNERGELVDITTPEGLPFGYEYFGNFPKSMFTMFQVLTGDSWSESVARPTIHTPDALVNIASGIFFASFFIICAVILINVVVAVLLEKMVDEEDTLGLEELVQAQANSEPSPRQSTSGRQRRDSLEVMLLSREVATLRADLQEIRDQVQRITLLAEVVLNRGPCRTARTTPPEHQPRGGSKVRAEAVVSTISADSVSSSHRNAALRAKLGGTTTTMTGIEITPPPNGNMMSEFDTEESSTATINNAVAVARLRCLQGNCQHLEALEADDLRGASTACSSCSRCLRGLPKLGVWHCNHHGLTFCQSCCQGKEEPLSLTSCTVRSPSSSPITKEGSDPSIAGFPPTLDLLAVMSAEDLSVLERAPEAVKTSSSPALAPPVVLA